MERAVAIARCYMDAPDDSREESLLEEALHIVCGKTNDDMAMDDDEEEAISRMVETALAIAMETTPNPERNEA